ncbi:MAG: TatD family hydrolase [Candidatus Thermoplasmatota archaeon]|nr:metal-dependent hydrolase [Euryarchaeota archaeon]MBU4032746.1 TatD family hydrolase [Candidatus Thermoplasmatota archaeon]MBU4071475.1 TatD family hydrolase [Candidatus Thermoplasmatota archaeon]MBU4144262.1 TatD family hydrolase [Candidatus Thermoplasmatota archaeon]MBU4592334.1 TatD family hydrolase [Candidatus Thermoplasmatota archaeon]
MPFPILDNHMHLQPEGRNVEWVKEFHKAGGTHMILSHLPYKNIKIKTGQDFRKQYEITLKLAEKCRLETDVKVYVMLGPYPGYMAWLWEELGEEKTVETMTVGMDIAAEFVQEGKALGIGEIGRPHFPVSPAIWKRSNEVLKYGMKLAKENGCTVQLHTESASTEVWHELAGFADEASLPRERVVKHYSGPAILDSENFGLFPSVLASKTNISVAAGKGDRFMMETDFLDDPGRPGAVLAATTVPKRTKAYLESGIFTDEMVARIHGDWPRKVYGLDISLD